MQVIIACRDGEMTERRRETVRRQLEKLERFEPRASRVEVTLSREKTGHVVEALLSVDRGGQLHAHGEAADFRTALDQATERLSRQLRKQRARHRDHQGPTKEEVTPGPDGAAP